MKFIGYYARQTVFIIGYLFFSFISINLPKKKETREENERTWEIMWFSHINHVHQVSDAQPALWKGSWQQICALSNPVPNLFLTILNLIFPKPTLFWYKNDLTKQMKLEFLNESTDPSSLNKSSH